MLTAAEKKFIVKAFGRYNSPIEVTHNFLENYGFAKGKMQTFLVH